MLNNQIKTFKSSEIKSHFTHFRISELCLQLLITTTVLDRDFWFLWIITRVFC